MRYVSTRGEAPVLGFDDVLLRGLAADGGLYVPETWPRLDPLPDPTAGYPGVVAEVIAPFMEGSVVADRLPELAAETYAGFRHPDVAPLTRLGDRWLLELFWGPTLSFKDYALQLVGRLFDAVLAARGERVLVLGATSGDTGSAAIEACRDREAVDIVILYPEGRVSEVQRRQMTTVDAPNVQAVAVEGTFDDCQDLVKAAFGDEVLRSSLRLAAVNSINWARVMAQAAYHVWASTQVDGPVAMVVPTGNFGNVLAADVARRLGAPIERMVIANNANHGLTRLVETGRLPAAKVAATLAPAMDIQVPSNLERELFELSGRDGAATADVLRRFRSEGAIVLDEVSHSRLRERFSATWLDDAGIEATIARVHETHGVLVDPHTATGWHAADTAVPDHLTPVVVATAHPAKFGEAVERATGVHPELPPDLSDLLERPEHTRTIPAEMNALRSVLKETAHRM